MSQIGEGLQELEQLALVMGHFHNFQYISAPTQHAMAFLTFRKWGIFRVTINVWDKPQSMCEVNMIRRNMQKFNTDSTNDKQMIQGDATWPEIGNNY